MFKSLRTSAARASVLSTVLLLFVGVRIALVGGLTNLAFDAFTNPTVHLAWAIIAKVAQHRLAKLQATPKTEDSKKAKKTMRRPIISSTVHLRSVASTKGAEGAERAEGADLAKEVVDTL